MPLKDDLFLHVYRQDEVEWAATYSTKSWPTGEKIVVALMEETDRKSEKTQS